MLKKHEQYEELFQHTVLLKMHVKSSSWPKTLQNEAVPEK